jgi:hypothetical protein
MSSLTEFNYNFAIKLHQCKPYTCLVTKAYSPCVLHQPDVHAARIQVEESKPKMSLEQVRHARTHLEHPKSYYTAHRCQKVELQDILITYFLSAKDKRHATRTSVASP